MCKHRTVALSLGSMPLLWLTWESKLFGPWGANWVWSWHYNPICGGRMWFGPNSDDRHET